MKRKNLTPAVNCIPVWSDVPVYEDWILALGREDSDESYGAYLEAFEDEVEVIMMDSHQSILRLKNDD